MNVRFLFFPRQSSGRTFPAGPGSGRRCCALLRAGSPRTLPAAAPRPGGPLAGVSVLLVAHQRAVVAQDLHGVLPVPARAAEVLEADLRAEHRGNAGASPAAKGHQQSRSTPPSLPGAPTSTVDPWAGERECQRCCAGPVGPSFRLLNRFESLGLGTGAAAGLCQCSHHSHGIPASCSDPIPTLQEVARAQPGSFTCTEMRSARVPCASASPRTSPRGRHPDPSSRGSQSSSLPSPQGHQSTPH